MADVCDQTGLQASWSIGMCTGKQGGGGEGWLIIWNCLKRVPNLLHTFTFHWVLTKMASLGEGSDEDRRTALNPRPFPYPPTIVMENLVHAYELVRIELVVYRTSTKDERSLCSFCPTLCNMPPVYVCGYNLKKDGWTLKKTSKWCGQSFLEIAANWEESYTDSPQVCHHHRNVNSF